MVVEELEAKVNFLLSKVEELKIKLEKEEKAWNSTQKANEVVEVV